MRRAWLSLGMCRFGVRTASWVVPSSSRRRWHREWDAELVGWWSDAAQPERSTLRLWRRASIAMRDAFDARSLERSRNARRSSQAASSGGSDGPGAPGPGRRGNRLDDLGRDVRFGLRSLRRQPGFALVGILTIALGIAANTTIFSLVNGILLRPLAYAEPDDIVVVWPDH